MNTGATRRGALSGVGIGLAQLLFPRAAWSDQPAERRVREIENVWISMRDGVRLAARLWLPADTPPTGAVLEAIPYRKRDGTRYGDNLVGRALAAAGLAFVRVDLRGSGDSEGFLEDEYLPQQQDDALRLMDWIAAQPWSNGAIGMRGLSWGAFSALQAAALAPPALRAVVALCGADNRYTDDAHYMGGVLVAANAHWGAIFKNVLAGAPDPEIVGPAWKRIWLERLEAAPAIVSRWMRHQSFDAYWRHGSVSENYSAIKCPVLAVGGLSDAYVNAVPRLVANLKGIRKGVIGPWAHQPPHSGDPGPVLDWLPAESMWWRQWLNGEALGAGEGPALSVYVRERAPIEVWPRDTPGRWVAFDQWPAPQIAERALHLSDEGLSERAGAESERVVEPALTVGAARREWLPFAMDADLPAEQSGDDAGSLVFDSAPLAAALDIVGAPVLRVRVSADRPVAKIVVRLNVVNAAGESWPVSYGVLNLTHRKGHASPSRLRRGEHYDVAVALNFTSHRIAPGDRLRLAISESHWPLFPPSPQLTRLSVRTQVSRLDLPFLSGVAREQAPASVLRDRNLEAPRSLGLVRASGPDGDGRMRIERGSLEASSYPIPDTGTEGVWQQWTRAEIKEGDPESASWRVEALEGYARGAWRTAVRSTVEIRFTRRHYEVSETTRAFEGDALIFERTFQNRINRRLA